MGSGMDQSVSVVGASQSRALSALAEALQGRGWRLASAESCTGGLIAAACTDLAGSSHWFDRGFVTYSNASKTEMLGVDSGLISAQGAVSEAVACAMALGAIDRSQAQVSVAVTGIAGPGGAVPGKPVGTVWIAWARRGRPARAQRCHFDGDRGEVRRATVAAALEGLLRLVSNDAEDTP